MAGLGTAATTLLTTKGLFIDDGIPDALAYGGIITPWFRLYLAPGVPPPPVDGGSNGGSQVFAPGTIKDLFKQIDQATGMRVGGPSPDIFKPINVETGKRTGGEGNEPWYVIPLEKESDLFGESAKLVVLKFNFNGKEHERLYQVSPRRARALVEVMNFYNATQHRVKVGISGVKRIASQAIVEIAKLRLRKKNNKY